MSDLKESDLCLFWGKKMEGSYDHHDCGVVLECENITSVCPCPETDILKKPLVDGLVKAIVCKCECSVCKHAWFKMKRPIIRNGEVIYYHGSNGEMINYHNS